MQQAFHPFGAGRILLWIGMAMVMGSGGATSIVRAGRVDAYGLASTDLTVDGAPFSQDGDTLSLSSDGSIILKAAGSPTASAIKWQIWLEQGRALGVQVKSSRVTEISWQIPPAYWSVNGGPYPLGASVAPIAGSAVRLGNMSALNCSATYRQHGELDIQRGVNRGTDPFAGIGNGSGNTIKEEGDFGLVKVRPTPDIGAPWILAMELRLPTTLEGEGEARVVAINYHYSPASDSMRPPPGDRTFGKSWDSTWGRVHMQVRGDVVTGTYDSRQGQYNGIFGGTLTGTIVEGSWRDSAGSGSLRLTLIEDGWRFVGTHEVTLPSGKVSMTRLGPAGTETPAPKISTIPHYTTTLTSAKTVTPTPEPTLFSRSLLPLSLVGLSAALVAMVLFARLKSRVH